MSFWGQLNFQDAASPLMEELIFFHDHAMMTLALVISFVGYATVSLLSSQFNSRTLSEGQVVEMVWTIIPALILILLAFPSLRLLYMLDEVGDVSLTLKAIGHQWYWSYEYSDFDNGNSFDSYMLPLTEGENTYRLLDVDNRVVLPTETNIRVLVTSADVIHSWTVPALGVKADAVPGRLNQLGLFINRSGIFYGQCSEICGANHSFMPIVVEAVPLPVFLNMVSPEYIEMQ